jgi:hypothetical protein
MKYFLPEWDDLVDPQYDFASDTSSCSQGSWENQVFSHEIYGHTNSDGFLLSRAIAECTKLKKERINALGVHGYIRIPNTIPVMGDCGAFDYIEQESPPYTTDDVLDYYTRLGFDYGVSVDHLIVPAFMDKAKYRYDLTIHNADEFLKEHRTRGLSWEPIGSVQGWDPWSYAECARQYAAMGYRYIALGSLVRKKTSEIINLLQAVRSVVPDSMKIHLFGIGRVNATREFEALGVTSVDSASPLRKAWLNADTGYLTHGGNRYAAIRIPQPEKNPRVKASIRSGRITLEHATQVEQKALLCLRGYDAGSVSLENTLSALSELDHLIDEDRKDHTALYRRTLEDKPWKNCPCEICRSTGVEVIVFRGNNRNRRRGFHNTWVWYNQLQRALAGENLTLNEGDDDA